MFPPDFPDFDLKGTSIPFIKGGAKGQASHLHCWNKRIEMHEVGRFDMGPVRVLEALQFFSQIMV